MVYVIHVLLTTVFHCTQNNGICHTCFADNLRAGSGLQFRPDPARKLSAKYVWHIPLLCVQWKKSSDDGQRNCPKHVEFYSKNKFEKCVYLVGFVIRIYHDARSPERQIYVKLYNTRKNMEIRISHNFKKSWNLYIFPCIIQLYITVLWCKMRSRPYYFCVYCTLL